MFCSSAVSAYTEPASTVDATSPSDEYTTSRAGESSATFINTKS